MAVLASAITGFAQATNSALTLDDAVNEALRHNAQLQSLRTKSGAMAQRPAQEQALPNPMFKFSGMDAADGGSFPNTNEKRFMLEQEFPWFGKRALRAAVAQKNAEAMEREFDAMSRDVVMMVKESYFELHAVQRAAAITMTEEEVLKRMERSAEAMNATGQRSQLDVLKAQSEITMLMPKLLELEQRQTTLQAKLNTLMNRPAGAMIGIAVTAPADEIRRSSAELSAIAAKTRPEIQSAQIQVARSEGEHQLMVKNSAPDYRLGIELRSFEKGDNMIMFTMGLDLPVWRGKNRAEVMESSMMVESSKAALEAAQRQTAGEIWEANAKLSAARLTLGLYQSDLMPQADSRFSASEAAYQTGKADFLDLLESERFRLNVRVMAAMAEGEVGMQFARLERAVGTELKTAIAESRP
jgi:outer membrane protein TolC